MTNLTSSQPLVSRLCGISAQSLAQTTAELEPQLASATPQLARELFGVLGMLDGSAGLRRALTDPARQSAEKSALLRSLVNGKVSAQAEQIVTGMAARSWANARDLGNALETVAATVTIAVAENDGEQMSGLERLENELFAFTRALAASHDLQRALSEPQASGEAKSTLALKLLPDASEPARLLIAQAVAAPRGARPQRLIEDFATLAAARQQRWIASVEVSRPLSPEQEQRLAAGLNRLYGRELKLSISVEPALIGGLRIRVADEVVEASVLSRLSELRRQLA